MIVNKPHKSLSAHVGSLSLILLGEVRTKCQLSRVSVGVIHRRVLIFGVNTEYVYVINPDGTSMYSSSNFSTGCVQQHLVDRRVLLFPQLSAK